MLSLTLLRQMRTPVAKLIPTDLTRPYSWLPNTIYQSSKMIALLTATDISDHISFSLSFSSFWGRREGTPCENADLFILKIEKGRFNKEKHTSRSKEVPRLNSRSSLLFMTSRGNFQRAGERAVRCRLCSGSGVLGLALGHIPHPTVFVP